MKRRPAFRLPVGPDDVVRHALAAYYRAVADATAPVGDPAPAEWSNSEDFISSLFDFMELRLRCEASDAGHEVHAEPSRLALCIATPLSRDRHIRDVDPALWDELQAQAMAHGCAAVSSAVGPALVTHQSGADATSADPIFTCPERQYLPVAGAAGNTSSHDGGACYV